MPSKMEFLQTITGAAANLDFDLTGEGLVNQIITSVTATGSPGATLDIEIFIDGEGTPSTSLRVAETASAGTGLIEFKAFPTKGALPQRIMDVEIISNKKNAAPDQAVAIRTNIGFTTSVKVRGKIAFPGSSQTTTFQMFVDASLI